MPDRSLVLLPLLGLCLLFGTAHPSNGQSSSTASATIQVRLQHDAPVKRVGLTAKAQGLGVVLPAGGAPVMRLSPGASATIGLRQNDVFIRREGQGIYATSLRFRALGDSAAWTLSPPDGSSKTYTGALRIAPDPQDPEGMLIVNEVPIEDYVASVVGSEYSFDDGAGTKAMAVVARTYGLFETAKNDGYDHADGKISQVYRGIDSATARARRAAAATRGEVLTYDSQPIQSVYFSSSGGHTANNEDVWKAKEPLPYLRDREDPYDAASPHHRWTTSLSRSGVLRALTRSRGTSVNGFLIEDRAAHGRVKTVSLLYSNDTKVEMNANAFRLALNRGLGEKALKSTWFDARRSGNAYVFEGRGYGHGVGLSQWGAHAMANEGKSYRDILRFYYTGVEIEQRPDLFPEASPEEVAQSPAPSPPDSTSGRIGW